MLNTQHVYAFWIILFEDITILDYNLQSLGYILNNVSGIDVNQANPMGGWTALHEVFSQNEGHVNFNDAAHEDKEVAKSNCTKVTDLLIAHGAKPLKAKDGSTPLMCLTFNGFSTSYCNRVIERYYRFEADYYGVDPEIYKRELYKLRANGFKEVPSDTLLGFFGCMMMIPKANAIDEFWRNVELSKKPVLENTSLLKMSTGN
ncbi:MAG TPA: hypothetical protein VLG50_06150 [Candidatus Saccharimonadales bacterium]|nr:hypothetical protein [Candidatus Saccharimonadales bacterium]